MEEKEKSSREKIMDEVYTWRRGYNPDLENDMYSEFVSIFEFICANYYCFRVTLETSKDKLNDTFTVTFKTPTKVFERIDKLTEYSFILHYDEDGRITSITWHDITPTDMPIYPRDPVWRLFKLAYNLFVHEKPKEVIRSRAHYMSKEELEEKKRKEELEYDFKHFKNPESMDLLIIHDCLCNIVKPTNPYECLKTEVILKDNVPFEYYTVLKFKNHALSIRSSTKALQLMVYDIEKDNSFKHMLGSLKVPFTDDGSIAIYIDEYTIISDVEDNISIEAFQAIREDLQIEAFFKSIYQLINSRKFMLKVELYNVK